MNVKIIMVGLITIVLILQACFVHAQNLIPNGDFELGPDSSSSGWCCGIDSVCSLLNTTTPGPTFWSVVYPDPDRMVYGDIPCNWDIDTAASGKAYIVFGWNEAGKATLNAPLEKDSVYRLTYYVSLNIFRGLYTQPNGFYFKFANETIYSPLISNPKWAYIDTIFTASANATEIEFRGSEFVSSGVNLNKICLEKINPNSLNNFYVNQIKIYPVPIKDKIYFNYLPQNIKQIVVINLTGQTVIHFDKNEIINNSISLSTLQNGLYLLKLETSNNIITKKITVLK